MDDDDDERDVLVMVYMQSLSALSLTIPEKKKFAIII